MIEKKIDKYLNEGMDDISLRIDNESIPDEIVKALRLTDTKCCASCDFMGDEYGDFQFCTNKQVIQIVLRYNPDQVQTMTKVRSVDTVYHKLCKFYKERYR